MKDLKRDIDFSLLMENMKKIYRKNKIIGEDRRENDAEHSFHVCINAMIFKDYCEFDFDLDKAIKMLLIHDLVEIYAGDTFCYSKKENESKKDRELLAIDRLKDLSGDLGFTIKDLWMEFEENSTNESKYANAMDRLQAVLGNIENNGGTWKEFSVDYKDILKRIEPIKKISKNIYDEVINRINKVRVIE